MWKKKQKTDDTICKYKKYYTNWYLGKNSKKEKTKKHLYSLKITWSDQVKPR